jgi:hypothetical protein
MRIVDLIKREHAKRTGQFEKLAETSNGAVKTRERLSAQLKTEVEVHAKVVQEHIYPLLRKSEETRDLVPDVKERNDVKRLLAALERTPKDEEDFLTQLKELKKVVEQNLRLEQRQIFPAIEKLIGGEEAEELAKRIAAETREDLQEAAHQLQAAEEDFAPSPTEEVAAQGRNAIRESARLVEQGLDMAKETGEVVSLGAKRGAESLQQAAESITDNARHVVEIAARRAEESGRSVRKAAEAHAATNERSVEDLRALITVPTTSIDAIRDVRRAWTDWVNGSVRTSVHFSQQLLHCRTPQQIAQIHRTYVAENLTGWLEGNARMLQSFRRISGSALRPIEQRIEDARQGTSSG